LAASPGVSYTEHRLSLFVPGQSGGRDEIAERQGGGSCARRAAPEHPATGNKPHRMGKTHFYLRPPTEMTEGAGAAPGEIQVVGGALRLLIANLGYEGRCRCASAER